MLKIMFFIVKEYFVIIVFFNIYKKIRIGWIEDKDIIINKLYL